MRIICCCLNAKYIHSSPAPWCLAAGVDSFCSNINIEIEVLESTINNDPYKIINEIVNKTPDIVTFSCYIWNITQTLLIAEKIKETLETKIVLGGPEVSYRSKDILYNYSFVDFVLSGEGEWCFSDLVNAIYAKRNLFSVQGLTFRYSNKIVQTDEDVYSDTPPSPFSDKYIATLNNRIAYIESSRGCPFRCAYCLSGRVSKLRFFDLSQIKKDIIALVNSGVQTIKFVDRTFNASKNHCNSILAFIKNNFNDFNNRLTFHFEISADILDESTIEILSTLPQGLVQLEIGIQSYNPDVLERINRKCNLEKLEENIKKLISFNNMHIHIDLIAGLTEESLESFIDGFNKAYRLKANMLQLGFLKLLYGSDMREIPEKYPCDYNDFPPYEVISTPWLTDEHISLIKNCEIALDKLYNSGRFLLTLDYLLQSTNLTPFELFLKFGSFCSLAELSLKDLSLMLFNCFKNDCNSQILREKICCDLISSGANINLPQELKVYSPLHKRLTKYFSEKYQRNIKIVILESSNKVFVISDFKKNLSGRYNGTVYDINNIIFQ